ncbi:MAG TPA: hypothetical protein VEM15_07180, partial [Thermodesulfobacteriota bacterium]|nr:hypothetical protein [Thermodesulfobacteriota bacterium]
MLEPSPFKVKSTLLLFFMTILPGLFSCAIHSAKGSVPSVNIDPFIENFIADHTVQIRESAQLIFATNRDSSSVFVTVSAVQKENGVWHLVFPTFSGSIGERGFAAFNQKREGDGKSPTGI